MAGGTSNMRTHGCLTLPPGLEREDNQGISFPVFGSGGVKHEIRRNYLVSSARRVLALQVLRTLPLVYTFLTLSSLRKKNLSRRNILLGIILSRTVLPLIFTHSPKIHHSPLYKSVSFLFGGTCGAVSKEPPSNSNVSD